MAWDGVFLIVFIKLVQTGVLFIVFCTVNWLDVKELNIETVASK